MKKRDLDEDAALRLLLEATAAETGTGFFESLVKHLAEAIGTHGAWVTEFLPESRQLRALAFWMDGQFVPDYQTAIDGTPCEAVIDTAQLVHFPENIMALYPGDNELQEVGAVSYMGVPLLDVDGTVIGHMAVLDKKPMPEEPRSQAVFRIFADRAAAELRRMRMESAVREREEKLARLVDGAMDAIIELDDSLRITHMNPAAESIFACEGERFACENFSRFLEDGSYEKLTELIESLESRNGEERSLWIPGGLQARTAANEAFSAEASLARYEANGQMFHTLILRNVNDRIEAERTIATLTHETQYLREELNALQPAGIIGQSAAMARVMEDIRQVAPADSTVLVLGETGTGKELVARALHEASAREGKPLVRVNCAAIPAALIESEFFGHEKGAFTGATERREGRFAVAHGGTIFLDEVGDLPLDLQAKLLRVLQEGEFEPVGSDRTVCVDVRVVAATNRDLAKAVEEGTFREDLYYRLNVFPIELPPLRERKEDIPLLTEAFIRRFAGKMGRNLKALTAADLQRLVQYPWPGNVRELENVIERAVITANAGVLNLDRALPETPAIHVAEMEALPTAGGRVRTMDELQVLERENIVRALDACNWKVSGDNGAARLLGMNPSTLNSRMRALGIKRPAQA